MIREEHLLIRLAEECNELAKVACKATVFGLNAIGPDGQHYNNSEDLVKEFNDIYTIMNKLYGEGFILNPINQKMIAAKSIKVEKYIEHSEKLGKLHDG